MEKDLTVIFLTNNEVPEKWAEYHLGVLKKAIGDLPVISLTRKKMDFGLNLLQDAPSSKVNIFKQMLRGAKIATTPYVAIAEDDVLYPPTGHFDFRPPVDRFAYNQHRWSLYTWGQPVYHLKNFMLINSSLICSRELLIQNLEKRFAEFPNDPPFAAMEIGAFEKKVGWPHTRPLEFKSESPIVQFDHDYFTRTSEVETLERRHTKKLGTVKAFDIPIWGKAEDLVQKFI